MQQQPERTELADLDLEHLAAGKDGGGANPTQPNRMPQWGWGFAPGRGVGGGWGWGFGWN